MLALLASAVVAVLSVTAARICWQLQERLLAPFLLTATALCFANLAADWIVSIRSFGSQWGRPPVTGPDGTLIYGGGHVWPAIIGPLLVVIVNALFLWFWSRKSKPCAKGPWAMWGK